MGPAYKSLILVIACVATILLLLIFAGPPDGPPGDGSLAPRPGAPAAATDVPVEADKFFFDVIGHSAGEFLALLERARMIYEQTPAQARSALEVVLVLHGPDIAYFATRNYEKYRSIVDLAAKLDAFGVFDFRMCAASAANTGLTADDVPAFIEFVPYGPTEIRRLGDAGFVEL